MSTAPFLTGWLQKCIVPKPRCMTPCPLHFVWLLSALHPLTRTNICTELMLSFPHPSPPLPALHPLIVTDACTEPMVSLLSSSRPLPFPPLSAAFVKPLGVIAKGVCRITSPMPGTG